MAEENSPAAGSPTVTAAQPAAPQTTETSQIVNESAPGVGAATVDSSGSADKTASEVGPKPFRGVYILPNLFTTASLFTGFLGMIMAQQGNIDGCAMAILFSAFMDGLDGKVARLTNTASEFGVQYDSLADLVAFGVAPAFMAWVWLLNEFGRVGIGVGFLFVACTALRLARFNVSTTVTSKKFFIGLPSPAGGCSLALFALFAPYVPEWLMDAVPGTILGVTFVVALLMVSRVRYFSFKEFGFLRTHAFKSMVIALLLFVMILAEPRVFGFVICVAYLCSGLIYSFILLPRRNRQLLNHLTQNL